MNRCLCFVFFIFILIFFCDIGFVFVAFVDNHKKIGDFKEKERERRESAVRMVSITVSCSIYVCVSLSA